MKEEREYDYQSLARLVLYKTWLLNQALELHDVSQTIGIIVSILHSNDVVFAPIQMDDWCGNYEGITREHRRVQRLKIRYDDEKFTLFSAVYGQFIRGFENSRVDNKKVIRIDVLHINMGNDDRTMGLILHTEPITFRNELYCYLIIMMEPLVNTDAAIRFARNINRQNAYKPGMVISSLTYNSEYCGQCQARACTFQYNGTHGCHCKKLLICEDYASPSAKCDCDCHSDYVRTTK